MTIQTDLVSTKGRTGVLHHRSSCKRAKNRIGSPATVLGGKACPTCRPDAALASFRKAVEETAKAEKGPRPPAMNGMFRAEETPGGVLLVIPSKSGHKAMIAVVERLAKGTGVTVTPTSVTIPDADGRAFVEACLANMETASEYLTRMTRRGRDAYLSLRPGNAPAKLARKGRTEDDVVAKIEDLNRRLHPERFAS